MGDFVEVNIAIRNNRYFCSMVSKACLELQAVSVPWAQEMVSVALTSLARSLVSSLLITMAKMQSSKIGGFSFASAMMIKLFSVFYEHTVDVRGARCWRKCRDIRSEDALI